MISVADIINKTNSKVMTTRKVMYDDLLKADKALFNELSDVLLMAFAFGYRMDVKIEESGGTAFVNVSAIDSNSREEYARLILHRHPEVDDINKVWALVQAYADGGVEMLHKMMVVDGKRFNIDDFIDE